MHMTNRRSVSRQNNCTTLIHEYNFSSESRNAIIRNFQVKIQSCCSSEFNELDYV